jgi:hypothetical protein
MAAIAAERHTALSPSAENGIVSQTGSANGDRSSQHFTPGTWLKLSALLLLHIGTFVYWTEHRFTALETTVSGLVKEWDRFQDVMIRNQFARERLPRNTVE